MSSIQKIRAAVYDAPATYSQFDGGINTNLSNEALEPNELRDGLNCHYVNKSLVNRKGERIIKKLILPINSRPQGDFLFSAENSDYIISVRNGHIFYGTYNDIDRDINMSLLLIDIPKVTERDSCDNYLIDIREETELDLTKDTEGFIYKFYNGNNDDPSYKPSEEEYSRTLIIQNTKRVQGIPITMDDKQAFIMATGLRILKITEEFDKDTKSFYLYGRVLDAYPTNSWDIRNIGVNNLSPFPNYLIDEESNTPKSMIGQILTAPKELGLNNLASVTATAKINCSKGIERQDFYYKWEARVGAETEWKVIHYWDPNKNKDQEPSKNKRSITLTEADLKKLNGDKPLAEGSEIFFRCTITDEFQQGYDVTKKAYFFDKGTDGDLVADEAIARYSRTHIVKKVRRAYTPSLTLQDVQNMTEQEKIDAGYVAPDNEFLHAHSCTKVVSDGDKLLFYDDAYDSCEWYKTVVGKPNYLSYEGNLNFRTNKNEKLIGVVIFDKNIIVFSDNEKLGGNISVVTGNGDSYNNGQYFSPYKRKIVNTSVSCDAYNTIKVAENYIIFKYRQDIYMLDTNELDAERINIITINDKVKQRLNNVEFPLDRVRDIRPDEHPEYDFHEYSKCLKPDEIFAEVYDGYYGLVFPHQGFHNDTYEYPENPLKYYEGSNEKYIEQLRGRKIDNIAVNPGLRWKCYFRKAIVYQNKEKPFFPWLRDTSKYLNVCNIIDINGTSTMITYNGELVQFNGEDYSGVDEYNYKVRVATRCYDMQLPTLCKFMDNLNVYYNRDFTKTLIMDCFVKNEAGYYLYTPSNEAYINLNKPVGEVKFDERYKIDDALNLLPGYGPIERYDEEPYVDPMDKPVQVLNQVPLDTATLDRPSFTSQTLTPKYRFPFLSAQFILEIKSNQAFSLSSLTFSYTSNDMPDSTREKLYREILKGNVLKR